MNLTSLAEVFEVMKYILPIFSDLLGCRCCRKLIVPHKELDSWRLFRSSSFQQVLYTSQACKSNKTSPFLAVFTFSIVYFNLQFDFICLFTCEKPQYNFLQLRGLVSSLIASLMLFWKCWWHQGSSLNRLYHDDYDDIEMAWHKWSDGVAKKSHPRRQDHIFVRKLKVTTATLSMALQKSPRRRLIVATLPSRRILVVTTAGTAALYVLELCYFVGKKEPLISVKKNASRKEINEIQNQVEKDPPIFPVNLQIIRNKSDITQLWYKENLGWRIGPECNCCTNCITGLDLFLFFCRCNQNQKPGMLEGRKRWL